MKIKRNMIVWAELKSGLRHIQAGRRPCIVISCDKANGKSPVYTVIPGTTKMRKNYIPVHFNIEPSEIRGFLRHTTMFLPEQLVQMPPITPHVCRHTFCSNMAKSGMNPKMLQYIMGHSDISVTMNTYTHVKFQDAQEDFQKAINS